MKRPSHPGPRLREARESNGLTQPELAERLGVTEQTIRNWESGRTRIGLAHLHYAGELLGADLALKA